MKQSSWMEDLPIEDWWHFKAVKYEDGCYTFTDGETYLPTKMFEEYRTRHSHADNIQVPYVALNSALESLTPMTEKIESAILSSHSEDYHEMDALHSDNILSPLIEWIRCNGPLGIFLHETRRIVQPAIWQLRGNTVIGANPVDLWVAGEGWTRIWVSNGKTGKKNDVGQFVQPDKEKRDKEFYCDLALINSELGEKAESLVRLVTGKLSTVDYFKQFLHEHYFEHGGLICPAPLSGDFMDIYREPAHLFLLGAYALCNAIKGALSDNEDRCSEGRKTLLHLSAPASFILMPGFRGGQYELTFSAPSLLSALASWANTDIVAGKAFLCKQCRKLHASPATKSMFCSDACRQLHSKQKGRAKEKARKLQEKDMSIVEIARELKRDVGEVEEWFASEHKKRN